MWELIQNSILGIVLILALGFIVFRLSTRSKALAMNEAPSCHGDSDAQQESTCTHCHPGAAE